jgi:large subunit ribosomal protein L28
MAYSCEICGKGKQFGHNVPFSQKKTNKVWKPNLQRTRLDVDGTKIRVKICTQCMRTLAKYQREAEAKDVTNAEPKTATKPEVKKAAAAKKPAKATA